MDVNTIVNVRFKGGAVGTISTIGNAAHHDEGIAIHGSEGGIVFRQHRWRTKFVHFNDRPMRVPARIRNTTPDADFLRFIRNGGKGYTSPDYTVRVAKLSEAAYRSAAEGRPVRVAT